MKTASAQPRETRHAKTIVIAGSSDGIGAAALVSFMITVVT